MTASLPFSILLPALKASGENKTLISEVENLHEKKEYEKEYQLMLPYKASTDADILWRLARASTDIGKTKGDNSEERKTKIYEAFGYATRALELDDKNFACHKWYGILLDYTAEYEGNKARISNAFKVKEHFEKAIELNPQDATTMHCLGVWCFLFADMPWYTRKIAAAIFASPPTSTYEEAMKFFQLAENTEPGFYSKNKVMLGKTAMRLGDRGAAKEFLLDALRYVDKTVDDQTARKEAQDLLKELGVKL